PFEQLLTFLRHAPASHVGPGLHIIRDSFPAYAGRKPGPQDESAASHGVHHRSWAPAHADSLKGRPYLLPLVIAFMALAAQILPLGPLKLDYDRERLEDAGYLTCMTLVLLGNYSQTGHFGGPLAYTPYNVATHLAGPGLGGLRFDYRRP